MYSLKDFLTDWRSDSPCIKARTSGSTGTPKVIELLKADMRQSAVATNAFFGIGAGSTLAIPLSMEYIAGKMMAVRAEVAGCRLLELPVSTEVVLTEYVDLLSVVPPQAQWLIAHPEYLSMVGTLLIGGAAVDRGLAGDICKSGCRAYIGYGMTETCSHVALRRLSDGEDVYRAMPGISFSADSDGCLIVRSEDFSWKELHTRDVVSLVDGRSFVWLGRMDNVINSGGIKVFPERVEEFFGRELEARGCGRGLEFIMAGEPSSKWGEAVTLVARGGCFTLSELQRVVDALSWPRGWKPVRVSMVESLPRTANGKVKRKLSL